MTDDLICKEIGCVLEVQSKKWNLCGAHYRKFLHSRPKTAVCVGCTSEFPATGRKSYCSDSCRINSQKERRASHLPEIHPTHKLCARCNESKLHASFGKDNSRRDKLFAYCKDCVREYEGGTRRKAAELSKIEYNRRRHAARKLDPILHTEQTLANRNKWLVAKYGISIEEYERILAGQGGVCAICTRSAEEVGMISRGGHLRPLSVDHDHSCCPSETTCGNCIRQLLCHYCNFGVGAFRDNPDTLREAAKYLEKHENSKNAKSMISLTSYKVNS